MSNHLRSPDYLLAREQFPELNEAFYATRPWEYFQHRWRALMLAAGAGDRLREILKQGVHFGKLDYRLGPDGDARAPEEDEGRRAYMLAESEVLLHHVSETLLRIYLAHEPLPECPWLEIARVRSPRAFKRQVEQRFVGHGDLGDQRRNVATLFFGTSEPSALTPTPPRENWEAGIDNIEAFLSHYARLFLDSDVYNSLKHGLAVRPGESRVQLGDGQLLAADGPSIEYLSIRKDSAGRARWNRSSRWVEIDRACGSIFLATRLLQSLWGIARARYLGETPGQISLWTAPSYAEFATPLEAGESARVIVDSFHSELAYYVDPTGEDVRVR